MFVLLNAIASVCMLKITLGIALTTFQEGVTG